MLTFIGACVVFDERLSRTALALCLLVFALTFPGRNRFRDSKLTAAVDIVTSWVTLVAILALCAYATRSLNYFEREVLIAWVLFAEPITAVTIAGTALTAFGVSLVVRPSR